MKWVTLQGVHLDRVATPWLIKRFVDRSADFFFVAPGGQHDDDAIPFALPGAKLAPHDEEGSTFRRVLVQYGITDAALDYLAGIIEAGIDSVLRPAEHLAETSHAFREGIGLNAFSEGMVYSGKDDQSILIESEPLYDALYTYCRAKVLERELAPELMSTPQKRLQSLKGLMVNQAQAKPRGDRSVSSQ